MNSLAFTAERAASMFTKQIALRWGESFPFYYVCEYPKSGGTWLASMVATYLQIPCPRRERLPIAFKALLQAHWTYDPRLRRVITITRDGRDVMSSMFYDRIRVGQHSNEASRSNVAKIYRKVFGRDHGPDDIVELMPRFLEFEFNHPGRGVHASWPDFVMGWHERPQVTSVSYEGLLENTAGELRKVLEQLTGEEVDTWRLETAVEMFSFQRMTGRKRGTSDITQHARKGIAGDWKNTFSREAAEIFNQFAGDVLITLGYEKNKDWLNSNTFPTS